MKKEESTYTDKNGAIIYRRDYVRVDDDWDSYGWAAGMVGYVDKSPTTGKWCVVTIHGRFTIEDNPAHYLELTIQPPT